MQRVACTALGAEEALFLFLDAEDKLPGSILSSDESLFRPSDDESTGLEMEGTGSGRNDDDQFENELFVNRGTKWHVIR